MIGGIFEKSWRIITLVACVFVAGCGGSDIDEQEIIRPARLLVISPASERLDVSFPAIVEARNSSTLTFQVGGLLTGFPVSESQFVRRGQVLARLDQRRYANAVASAQAQFDAAQRDYESAAALLEQNAIAEIQVRQREAQRDVAAASLDSVKKDLADTVLRAPFSGVVAEKLAVRFENVSPQQDIVTLQSTGAAEAVVSVPASLVPRFSRKRPTNAYVVLSSAPDVQIPGSFLAARTQADTQSQTFRVKFAFNPPPNVPALPGSTATVYVGRELLEEELEGNGISVPLGAVLSDGKARYVWVVDRESMTVSKRTVTVADSIGEEIAISDGLKPGETIVAAGAAYLHDGMKIRPYDS
ncbi:efflux RND transporter periplasmic adaptor subunit [uncultured Erythrobacter sp.]|uniref:efflux RND transporter periplasmic adaptor subunit n=1 Tax=uncultured Erythrobacter sp. TaxID=263913 RepID=UPI00263603BE|nr:efflux RND transporter periplasmic adaptor subunit [uncultured Erythrobacter sp.]